MNELTEMEEKVMGVVAAVGGEIDARIYAMIGMLETLGYTNLEIVTAAVALVDSVRNDIRESLRRSAVDGEDVQVAEVEKSAGRIVAEIARRTGEALDRADG